MERHGEMLSRLIESFAARGYFPQASFAVFNRQGILCRGACGGASPETVYDLASLTKLFTTTILLKLADEGRLELEGRVLPLLDVPAANGILRESLADATLAGLLTHTAGLPAWYPFYAGSGSLWDRMEQAIAHEEGGEKPPMVYSDLGFILAGRLAEQAAERSLPEAAEEYIRRPLGIEILRYLPKGSPKDALAGRPLAVSCYGNSIERDMCRRRGICFDGFRPDGVPVAGEANDGNAWYYFGGVSGHAGLFSDIDGVAALGRFYLTADRHLFRLALRERSNRRGLGFECGPRYPGGCGHTGFTGTSLYLCPDRGIGGVLLTNRLAFPTGEAKNIDPCRRAFHEAILTAVEQGGEW